MSPVLSALVLAAAGSAAGLRASSQLTRRRILARLAAGAARPIPGAGSGAPPPAPGPRATGQQLPRWATPARLAAGTTAPPVVGRSSPGRSRRPDMGAWASPTRLAAGGVGAAVGLAALVAAAGPMVLVVGSLASVAVPLARRRRRLAEARRLRKVQLPAALERLATALRAGSSVPGALAEVGGAMPAPIGPELAALGREADAGRAVVEVLDGWSARHDDIGTRLAATALTLATTVGGAPGHAVDGVAATLRERVDLADERRALASQARMSALVLAVAPVGFALLLGAADGAASSFLLGTPAGWTCLGAGLALDGVGAWWMARLTRGAET